MKIIQGIEAKVKSVCGDISQPWPPINERFALAKRLSNCQSRRKVGRTIRGRNLASLWNPLVTEMPWAGPLLRQGEQRLLSLGQVHDVPGRRHVLADVLGSLDPPEKGMWEYVNRVFFQLIRDFMRHPPGCQACMHANTTCLSSTRPSPALPSALARSSAASVSPSAAMTAAFLCCSAISTRKRAFSASCCAT